MEIKSFTEFKQLWEKQTASVKPFDDLKHLVFIVVYPDDLEWSFAVQKQTQMTVIQTSGGITGSGVGHIQKLCYRSELQNILLSCNDYTHVMIVSVGMIFDMTASISPITRFYDFAKSGDYCKGHILSGSSSSRIHQQHIELNLDTWRNLGSPYIWEVWKKFERSNRNHHDDYTPLWLKPEDRPLIKSFRAVERKAKAWSYPILQRKKKLQLQIYSRIKALKDDEDFKKAAEEIDPNETHKDMYTKILMRRMTPKFYSENTELIGKLPDREFDLIFTPTAGYSGEIFCDRLNFKGEIIFYDYCEENIMIKKQIVEKCMTMDQIKNLNNSIEWPIVFNKFGFLQNHFPDYDIEKFQEEYGDRETLRSLQDKMTDTCKITYFLIDLLKTVKTENHPYIDLVNKIKGKNVFFDVSNIFSYHVSHAGYTLDELVDTLEKLKKLLKTHTKSFYIKGTAPGKQEITL